MGKTYPKYIRENHDEINEVVEAYYKVVEAYKKAVEAYKKNAAEIMQYGCEQEVYGHIMMLDEKTKATKTKKPHFISEADNFDVNFMGDEATLKAIDPDGVVTVLREEHRVKEVFEAISKFYSVEETEGSWVSASAYKIKGSDKAFFVWSVNDFGSCGDVDCFIASPMRGIKLLSEVWQWLATPHKYEEVDYIDFDGTKKTITVSPDGGVDEIQNIELQMCTGE